MKFYYNGKLMRTSKKHHYTHAIIDSREDCIMCSSSYEGCLKEIRAYVTMEETRIGNCTEAIKSIECGKKDYTGISFGKKARLKVLYTIDEYKRFLESAKETLEYYKNNWKIVELTEEE